MNLLFKIITIGGIVVSTYSPVKAIEGENQKSNNDTIQNSKDSVVLPFQISFVPYFGTGGFASEKAIYEVSLNILAGYNYGVSQCEIGGILNIIQHNVSDCQIAGVGNIVLGNMKGFQAAGTFNMANSVNGMQVAGMLNTANNLKGMQISGCVNNATKGGGSQISGLANHEGDSAEFQIAGLVNNTPVVKQFQLSGLVNNAKIVDGFQLAGLVNNANQGGEFQVAGLINNVSEQTGFQMSGLVNNAPSIKSFQIAGLVNNANDVEGFQISGLVNRARVVKGFQIGVVNVADSCTMPIGLINFVKGGYHKLELSAGELFYTNIAYRSGVRAFHGIITAGIRPDNFSELLWSYGVGFGTSARLSNKMLLDIDYTFHHVIVSNYTGDNFLNRFYVGVDWQVLRKGSIFFGLTYNFLGTDPNDKDYQGIYSKIPNYYFTNNTWNHLNLKTWAGFKVGIRFF